MTKKDFHDSQLEAARHTVSKWSKIANNPRDIGRAKVIAICLWVYRWGYTSAPIIEALGLSKRTGLAARMVKLGLLIRTRTPSGGFFVGEPAFMYTLSADGLRVATNHEQEFEPREYQLDPHKRSKINFLHDLSCQWFVYELNQTSVVDIQPEAMIRNKSDGSKQPDCIIYYPVKNIPRYIRAIEIEFTKKHGRARDEFIRKIYEGIKLIPDPVAVAETKRLKQIEIEKVDSGVGSMFISIEGRGKPGEPYYRPHEFDWSGLKSPEIKISPALWHKVDVVVGTESIVKDYEALMQEGAKIKKWVRPKLKWVEDTKNPLIVTKEMASRFKEAVKFHAQGSRLDQNAQVYRV